MGRLSHMQRTRNEKRWKVEFSHYGSIHEFTKEKRGDGAHSIQVNGQPLDFLVENRNAETTLVVFSGALSLSAKHTPAFSGLRVAADTGVNLIAVADPSMDMGEITVAWYLGNSVTGPLRSHLSRAIHHLLEGLGSTRTILFGGSGGGYAAAHLAYEFPDSIAFIFNPRLTLDRRAERALKRYFNQCHDTASNGKLGPSHLQILKSYGPVNISSLATSSLKHDLLIYQNLLDPEFLEHQLLPYLNETAQDSRLQLRFSADNVGHGPIPEDIVRNIIVALVEHGDQDQAITQAGFLPRDEAITSAIHYYPQVARQFLALQAEHETDMTEIRQDLNDRERARRTAAKEAKDNRTRQIRFRKTAESLERTIETKEAEIESLTQQLTDLEHRLAEATKPTFIRKLGRRLAAITEDK